MPRTSREHPENSAEGQAAKRSAIAADTSTDPVQTQVDTDHARGFRGIEVDTTPNENYSVAGVTSGAPTPETDPAQAEQVRRDRADIDRRAAGVAER